MARTLTIRGVSDAILQRLRARAAAGRRSLNSELLTILEAAAGNAGPAVAADTAGNAGPSAAADAAANDRAVHEPAPAYGAAHTTDLLGDVDLEELERVCRRHHIRRLDVFGSVAAGTAQPGSDVDVIAEFEPGRTPGFDIVRVAESLRPVFGRRVDLHTPYELRRMRDRVRARTLYAAG